jgi:hypothetical protein
VGAISLALGLFLMSFAGPIPVSIGWGMFFVIGVYSVIAGGLSAAACVLIQLTAYIRRCCAKPSFPKTDA